MDSMAAKCACFPADAVVCAPHDEADDKEEARTEHADTDAVEDGCGPQDEADDDREGAGRRQPGSAKSTATSVWTRASTTT